MTTTILGKRTFSSLVAEEENKAFVRDQFLGKGHYQEAKQIPRDYDSPKFKQRAREHVAPVVVVAEMTVGETSCSENGGDHDGEAGEDGEGGEGDDAAAVGEEEEIEFTDSEAEVDPEEAEQDFRRMMEAAEAASEISVANETIESVRSHESDEVPTRVVDELQQEKSTETEEDTFESVSEKVVPLKKREAKASHKTTCTGCQAPFWKLTNSELRLCHNCVKIHLSVVELVQKNRASVRVVHDERDHAKFLITCMRGHQWFADFRAKQGRRWCQTCPAIERRERRQAILEEAARQQEILERHQREMFEQARQNILVEEIKVVEEVAVLPSAEAQFIAGMVESIIAGTSQFDEAEQHRVVEVINGASEEQIAHALAEQVPEQHRQRVARRIAFMVHPDKNSHARTTEAFQIINRTLLK